MEFNFYQNSYLVLGLEISASKKDIFRRSKEILSRLKIDDLPKYDTDTNNFDKYRTQESVSKAVKKLQLSKNKIKEFFFWFHFSDDIDMQALESIKSQDFIGAINVWKAASKKNTTKSLNYKKNLAISYTLLLSKKDNDKYLVDSLILWKETIESDKFWRYFSKIYDLYNEQTSNKKAISDFKNKVTNYLADIYTELWQINKNDDFISEFQSLFSTKGEKIEKTVLNPSFQKINGFVEQLENMKVSEDGVIDNKEKKTIKKLIESIKTELNVLIDLGLFDDSQTQIMRDRAASALRIISLDLYNNLDQVEIAEKLLEISIELCGSESKKGNLLADSDQISKNLKAREKNILSLEIPGFLTTNTLILTYNAVEYKGETILYKDATAVSWHSTKNSTNGIPTGQSYNFTVESEEKRINVSFSAAFRGGDKHNEIFARIVGVSNGIIEPIIVKKIVKKIFNENVTVNIGSLYLDDTGYHKTKFFGGINELRWSDVEYKPQISAGYVKVYETNNNDNRAIFASIPMSAENAVLIPELITECLKEIR